MMRFIIFIFLLGCSAHQEALYSLKQNLGVYDLKSFKRSPQTERWDLSDNPKWNRDLILKDLTTLGFVNSVYPKKSTYQTAVLLGSLKKSMQQRINFLVESWNKGIRFSRIVFLTGNRAPILPEEGLYANETKLFQALWNQTSMPKILRNLPTTWIDAPQLGNKRPTTVSTIQEWQKIEKTENDDILAFSNQPFVRYQECTLQNYLHRNNRIEAVGPQANSDVLIAVYMDALVNCEQFCQLR